MRAKAFMSANLMDLRMIRESAELVEGPKLAGGTGSKLPILTQGTLTASFGYPGTPDQEPKTFIVELWWEGKTVVLGEQERTLANYSNRFRAVFRVTDFVGFEWPVIPLEVANPYIAFVEDVLHRRVESTLSLLGIHGQVLKRSNLAELKQAHASTSTPVAKKPSVKRAATKGKSGRVSA